VPPPTKSHGSFARLTAWGASGGVAGYVATGRPFPLRSDAESTISSYFRLCTLEKSAASVENRWLPQGVSVTSIFMTGIFPKPILYPCWCTGAAPRSMAPWPDSNKADKIPFRARDARSLHYFQRSVLPNRDLHGIIV
jgi:hypothetical protein